MPTLHLIHSKKGLLKALGGVGSEDFLLILNQDLLDAMEALDTGNWAWLPLDDEDQPGIHHHAITIDDMVTLSTQYKPILTWR